jgi:hypothetical protein
MTGTMQRLASYRRHPPVAHEVSERAKEKEKTAMDWKAPKCVLSKINAGGPRLFWMHLAIPATHSVCEVAREDIVIYAKCLRSCSAVPDLLTASRAQ